MPEGKIIKKTFSEISTRYDCVNHLLSFGIDYYWRRQLVKSVAKTKSKFVVDLATGSGDVAFSLKKALGNSAKILGIDFCPEMLAIANKKKSTQSMFYDIDFQVGDCLDLEIGSDSVDAITIAFGYRNFENRVMGLKEMHRILKPGGTLYILEFTQADKWFKPIYSIYLNYLLPLIGGLVSGKKSAYNYLATSVRNFPTKEEISEEIRKVGFRKVEVKSLTFSTVALHCAIKKIKIIAE